MAFWTSNFWTSNFWTSNFWTGATAPTNPPAAVDDLAAASYPNGKIRLTWSAVAEATGYRVYRGTATGVTSGTGTLVATKSGTGFIDDVGGEVERFYVVVAYNGIGDASDSNEASATGGAATHIGLNTLTELTELVR